MRRRFRPKDWPARKRRTGTPMVLYGVPIRLWQAEYLTREELAARYPHYTPDSPPREQVTER